MTTVWNLISRTFFLLPWWWLAWALGGVWKGSATASNALTSNKTASVDMTYLLVSFQLEKSNPGHLIVVIDESFHETSSIVEASFEKGIGVTVVIYEPNTLREYLQMFYQSSRARKDIIVACSANNTAKVFQEVNRDRLETGYFRWFVLAETSVDNYINHLIFEENQVIIFEGERKESSKIRIKEMVWMEDNSIRFDDIGWVSSQSMGFINGRTSFPTIFEKFSNFQGRTLKVGANNYIVFFRQRTLENGEVAPFEGVDYNIVSVLAQVYNFTFQVVHPEDGRWGGPSSDGTISGLIGLVARHESHFSIHEITITATRETVVDFTKPYYTEGSRLVSKVPDLKNLALAVVIPFSYTVWGLIFGSLIVIGITVMTLDTIFRKLVPPKDDKLKDYPLASLYLYYLFNMFRNLVIQGNRVQSESSAIRVILGLWFLISIIIYAVYSGTLCAVFAAPSFVNPINSLTDLLKAAREDGVYPIVSAETAMSYLFERATYGTHQEIFQYFDSERSHAGYDERYSQAAKGKAVIMSTLISNTIKTNVYGRDKYHIGNEPFFFQSYGIVVANGSPLRFTFSKTLQSLLEGGLIPVWIKEAVTNELRYNGIIGGDRGNVMSRRTRRPNKPISIVQLQTAFFILAIGFSMSFLFLLFEGLHSKFSKNA